MTSYQKISDYWRRQKKEEKNYFKGVFHFKGFSKQTFSLRKHLQQHINKKKYFRHQNRISYQHTPIRKTFEILVISESNDKNHIKHAKNL